MTSWITARQAPLSMGFSRQEHWSELPFSPVGDLPDPGIKPVSLMSPALAGGFFTTSATWEALFLFHFADFFFFKQIESLWQPCTFPMTFAQFVSKFVSVSHFGNFHNISKFHYYCLLW